jgi:energy-coupling factor transporter ATP-binding protein EcfA2
MRKVLVVLLLVLVVGAGWTYWRRDSVTIILVTHDANVATFARRVIHICDGTISNGALSESMGESLVSAPGSADGGPGS